MKGKILTEAQEWFMKAMKMEKEGKSALAISKALTKALELEKMGIANGESW